MTLGLFFTLGVSVETWDRHGILEREARLYEELLRRGIFERVLWFTYGAGDAAYGSRVDSRIRIVPRPAGFRGKLGDLLYSFVLPARQRERLRECTVFKTNQMRGSWSAVRASKRLRRPLGVRTGYSWSGFVERGGPRSVLDRFCNAAERYAYRNCSHAWVTSAAERDRVLQTHGLPASRISVVPNFVDTERFRPRPVFRSEPFRVLYVGRIDAQKNVETLVRAVGGLDLDLEVVSPSTAGHLEAAARRANARLSVRGAVPHSELPGILNAADVFVLPSLYEGAPKALLEAMACGLPVLATDVPGTRETVEHGRTGWLVPPTVEGLRAGLTHLRENPGLRRQLGRGARRETQATCSFPAVFEQEAEALRRATRG